MIDLNPNRPLDELAADIFHDNMKRLGLQHQWTDHDTFKPRWQAVAHLVREIVAGIQPTTAEAGVREEAEKMLRFVQGADLGYCSLDVQREARERVYALRRALKGKGV